MKKILTAVCMLTILLGLVRAQGVDFYSFTAQATGETFVPLSGATPLDKTDEVTGAAFGTTFFNQTESLAHIEDQEQELAGIPLGFDFKFGGLVYDKFIVVGKGYLLLGGKSDANVKIPAVTAYQLSLTTYPRIGLACNDGNYGVDGTLISYKLEGSTPNQVLTVEFLNMAYSSDATGNELFNYQIKLYESDNHIEFLFDGWTIPDGASDWAIGLRDAAEAHFRKLDDGKSWSNTIFSTSMQYWAEGSTFEEGLKYSFGLPPTCEKPTKTIENITVSSTTDNVDLDIEVSPDGEAEAFLVLASENPIEGTLESRDYQVGEIVNGATVIAREDWDSWTIKWQNDEETIFRVSQGELEGNKDYHYAVYLFNYKCTGTAFSDVSTKVVKTQTTAPESLVLNSFSLTDLNFSVQPNGLDEDVLIAMTNVKATNKWGDPLFIGDFAVPPADAKPGDTLRKADGSFGGVVLYTGKASDNIECDVDLDYYTVYHFGAFSKRSGGGYSSVFAQDDTITEARIPFDADFGNMISDELPYGWNGTSGFMVVYGENAVAADLGSNPSGDRREVILALPAMDIPDTSNAVLEMSYSFDPYGFDMVEKDSVVFEISKDNGATYEEIKTVTVNSSSMYVRRLAIQGYAGVKKALIRIRYVSYSTEVHSLSFSKVQVLPLAFCDVPTSVYVNSIYGENAEVSWTPSLSEEKAWNVSYAMKEDGGYTAWTDPINVTETSYQLSGLYGKTLYGVRVRAVCGVGDVSQWSTVKDFQSGLKPSFIEDFDNMEYYVSYWYPDTTVYLPDGWGDRMRLSGELKDTLRSSDITYYYDTEIAYDWKTNKVPVAGVSNGALTFKMNGFTTQVVKVPLFGLDGSGDPLFRMKMAFGNMGENGVFETVESTSADYSLHLLISTDGGSTYVVKDALNVWDADGLVAIGDESWFECDLSKYEGATSILFLAQGVTEDVPTTNHILYVDSVSVINQCAIAKLLQVRNITDTSAELLWEKDLMVDEWIVKLSDGISQTISETAASELLLEDLEPGTTYMVKVAHLCGADTSDWVEAGFTTGGIACDPITNLTVSEITRQSARLAWEGSAQNYRIRIRPTSDKAGAWTYFEVKDAQTYVLENLLKLTEYEGGVQSICGMAVSDTSEYVPFEPFTTLDLTCFSPTAVVAKTIDHQSASVTWTGDADRYQVQWSVRNSGVVSGEMLAEEDKATISGLTAETNYQVRVRSICAVGDTSEWSDYSVFKTDVMPPCPTPTNLRVESVTTNSAKLLWDMSEEVNFFILRYRAASETVWDSVKDLEEKTYELTDLEPSTAYIWSVMTQCVDGRYSGWGTQNRFETEDKVGNEPVDNSGLFITTSMNQIHLMNPSAIQIDRVKVYGTDGKLLEDYVIGSNENVILTTACRTRVVIVVVESQGTYLRFKTLLP